MIQHVCRYALYVRYVSVSSDDLDLVVVDEMDGRTRYLLRYGTVWYGTVLPLGGEGMLVCMYACTCAGLGGAVLGGAGAVRCGAGLGGAVLVRCWLHCRSLMKKKMKVKDKKRT